MTSFLYEYTVSVRRPPNTVNAGIGAYSGLDPNTESVIATGLDASVQIDRTGQPSAAKLPGDPIGAPTYRIMLPFSAVPTKGMIQERDVLVDDLGRRFQVIIVSWTMIGSEVRAQLLET